MTSSTKPDCYLTFTFNPNGWLSEESVKLLKQQTKALTIPYLKGIDRLANPDSPNIITVSCEIDLLSHYSLLNTVMNDLFQTLTDEQLDDTMTDYETIDTTTTFNQAFIDLPEPVIQNIIRKYQLTDKDIMTKVPENIVYTIVDNEKSYFFENKLLPSLIADLGNTDDNQTVLKIEKHTVENSPQESLISELTVTINRNGEFDYSQKW